MSGILALLERRTGAVDRRSFERLARHLRARAPDGLDLELAPPVALARAFLDTGARSGTEPGLIRGAGGRAANGRAANGRVANGRVANGRVAAVDARLDRPRELRRCLADRGVHTPDDPSDEWLLTAAWEAWGIPGLARIDADFAFAAWDPTAGRLTAARDLFGVRPLYYADVGDGWIVSNTLAPILAHPAVGHDKDPLGVLDQLLFDSNFEPEGTIWRQIRRVPPGCALVCDTDGARITRYAEPWMPPESRLAPEERVEQFRAALDDAVRARVRPGEPSAVSMSGGLDSTALAAAAVERGLAPRVHTLVYERAVDDREGSFAARVAEHLGLEHRLHPMDDYALFQDWRRLPWTPVPGDLMVDAIYHEFDRAVLGDFDRAGDRDRPGGARVVLTGWGGDPLLLPERGSWWRLVRSGRPDLALLELGHALRHVGRLPPLGLHTAFEARRRRKHWRSGFPAWLRPEFARRVDAEERWRRVVLGPAPGSPSPPERRPEAHRFTFDLQWSHVFERVDAGHRAVPLERRHPFFDRRVVECALAAPSSPWCVDKYLLRRAVAGRLPEAVRTRPKSPQAGDPRHPRGEPLLDLLQGWVTAAPEIEAYIRPSVLAEELERHGRDATGHERKLLTVSAPWRRPLNLAAWLARSVDEPL